MQEYITECLWVRGCPSVASNMPRKFIQIMLLLKHWNLPIMHNLIHIRWAGSFALFAAAFATGLEIERAERDRMTRCESAFFCIFISHGPVHRLEHWKILLKSGPTAENTRLNSTSPLKIIFLFLVPSFVKERTFLARFRDRSALFAGTKPAGDTEVTWGRPKGESDCCSSITLIVILLQITSHGGSCTTQDK